MFNDKYLTEVEGSFKRVIFKIEQRQRRQIIKNYGMDGLYALSGLLIQMSNVDDLVNKTKKENTIVLKGNHETIVCEVVETLHDKIELLVTYVTSSKKMVREQTRTNVVRILRIA